MSRAIEEEIIKQYIKKNKQERMLWELNNPQKREEVIWRFSKPGIFIEKCLTPIGYMDKIHMIEYLFKLSGVSNVYYIGEDYLSLIHI